MACGVPLSSTASSLPTSICLIAADKPIYHNLALESHHFALSLSLIAEGCLRAERQITFHASTCPERCMLGPGVEPTSGTQGVWR